MTQVTMEEVWKEINLASLHQHRQLNIDHVPMLRNQNSNNSIFQDLLNMPLNQEPPTSSSSTLHRSLLTPPAAVLSLNPHSISTHFDESARFGCFGKKRGQDSDESIGDRKHKRMIKNRESAARSRARKQECLSPISSIPFQIHVKEKKLNLVLKLQILLCIKNGICVFMFLIFQAYTNELELEIVHLQKENARLKRQEEQLKIAEATQHQTKRTLQRSSTAPF